VRMIIASIYIILTFTSMFLIIGSNSALPIISLYADPRNLNYGREASNPIYAVWGGAIATGICSVLYCAGYIVCGSIQLYFSYYQWLDEQKDAEKKHIVKKKIYYVQSV